jgi:microcystin-dependent protein
MADNITRILFRRGTDAQRRYNPGVVLLAGEPGYDTDAKRLFVGDGNTVGGNSVGVTNLGVVSALFATPGYNNTGYDPSAFSIIVNAGAMPGDIIYDQKTTTLWSLTSVNGSSSPSNYYVPLTSEFVSYASLSQGGGGGGSGFGVATAMKFTKTGDGVTTTFLLNTLSALPADPYSYRVDNNGVVQEPGVDYNIDSTSTPYTIVFTTAPNAGEKVVILAYSPTVVSTATPILNANSVLASPLYTGAGRSLQVNGNNQFVGNIGSGLAAITLSSGYGITLDPGSNLLNINPSTLITLISAVSAAAAIAAAASVPLGTVQYYSLSSNLPTGWYYCNGAALTVTVQQWSTFRNTLITAGYPFGKDVANNPLIPDLRGRFIRGFGSDGTYTSSTFGTLQADAFASHNHGASSSAGVNDPGHSHSYQTYSGGVGEGGNYPLAVEYNFVDQSTSSSGTGISVSVSTSIGNTGGAETRPANVALYPIIKLF